MNKIRNKKEFEFLQKAGRKSQLVWHGLNDFDNLKRFLASPIEWGEMDVRWHEPRRNLILRHDDYSRTPAWPKEKPVFLGEALELFMRNNRGAKIDFKQGGKTIDRAFAVLQEVAFPENQLWFNGDIRALGLQGVKKISRFFPAATFQCPIDGLLPLLLFAPFVARGLLKGLSQIGINRFSIQFQYQSIELILSRLREWGFEYNLYNIVTYQDLQRALSLAPQSVTADFFIPEWGLMGRGSGYRGAFLCP